MDLKIIIDQKDSAAKYMIDEITHICTKFEKRAPGSKGEQQACEYMADQMKEYGCDIVYVDEFKEIVARNYLVNERPDAILNIVDGTNLERNLL